MISIVLFVFQVFFFVCVLWLGYQDKSESKFSLLNHFPSEVTIKNKHFFLPVRFLEVLWVISGIAFGIFLFPMDHFSLYSLWLGIWILTQLSFLGLCYVDTKRIGFHYALDGIFFSTSMISFLLPCIEILHSNIYEYSKVYTIFYFLFFLIILFFLLHPKLKSWYKFVEIEEHGERKQVRPRISLLPFLEWLGIILLLMSEIIMWMMTKI